jgi:hypothetical protein
MLVLLIVVLVAASGLFLASVAARSTARWRQLVRELVPDNRLDARGLTWSVAGGTLSVETPLARAGMSYHVAARVLGRGPILALLDGLHATTTSERLAAEIRLAGAGASTVLARLRSLVALADALEALPIAEAMARAFVELPPETASSERLAAFRALVSWYPRDHEVLGVSRGLTRGDDDPALVAAAHDHLTQVTSGQPRSAASAAQS